MTIGLSLVVKATIILIAALGSDALLWRRHVLLCAAIWNAVLIALLVLPIAALALPELPLPLLPLTVAATAATPSEKGEQPQNSEASQRNSASLQGESLPPPGLPGTTANDRRHASNEASVSNNSQFHRIRFPLGASILAIYVIGLAACLIRLAAGLAAAARFQASGASIDCADWQERLARWRTRLRCRPVELRQSTDINVPLMVGFLRPSILLPHHMAAELEPRSRDAVIVHELAHVLRGDFGWQLLLRLVQALLWFHPLVWLAERRIHFVRERACDDFTIHALGNGNEYANTLLAIASRLAGRPTFGLGLAITRTPQIAARIEAIVDSKGNAQCVPSAGTRLLTFCICFVFADVLGTVAIVQAQQPRADRAESAAETSGVVSGQVILEDGGMPVAGAKVLFRDAGLRQATTDEAGRFRFSGIPGGHYRIWAVKGSLTSFKEPIIGHESSRDGQVQFSPMRLPLRVGKQITVTVTSSQTGEPIEGAKVELDFPDRQMQRTAPDGTAVLQALLPQPYRMTVQAAGNAREIREIDLGGSADMTSQSVALVPGGTIRGTIADEDGTSLAKANILFRTAASPVGFYGESPFSDANGEYQSLYLPLNTPIEVFVQLQDYESEQQKVTLSNQERNLQLNFRLKKRPAGGSIRGIVTDTSNQPIAGASVVNFGNGPKEIRQTKTDGQGSFVLNDMVKGYAGYELIVRAAGFVTVEQRVEPSSATNPASVSITLAKGHSICARVQDTAGRPIPGAYVDVNGGGYFGQIGQSLRTDKDGQFNSASLAADSTFRIYADRYSPIEKAILKLDGDEQVIVTLEPMGRLKGQVIDAATGNPVEEFRVRIAPSSDRRADDISGTYPYQVGKPGLSVHSKEGKFSVNELTRGMAFQLLVEAEGYEPTIVPRVVALPESVDVKVSLKKGESFPAASLSGTVIDHDGNPVSGVQVLLIVSNVPPAGETDHRFNWALIDTGQLSDKEYVDQYLSAVTDKQGRFELHGLLPNKHLQLAYWGNKSPKGRVLNIAKTQPGVTRSVTVKVSKPATIRASYDAEVFPTASQISLISEGSFQHYQFAVGNGKTDFMFERIPPGVYSLSILGPPQRDPDNPQLIAHPPLIGRRLTVHEGAELSVQFTKDEPKPGPKR